MGRPSKLTARVAAQLQHLDGPGMSLPRLRARLAEAGIKLSPNTLRKYRKQGPPAPARSPFAGLELLPEEGAPAGVDPTRVRAAIANDDLSELREAQAEVAAARRGWVDQLSYSAPGVRAYGKLVALQREISQSIIELTPTPDVDRYKPIEGAALAELLATAEASARTDEDLRGQIHRMQNVIDDLLDKEG